MAEESKYFYATGRRKESVAKVRIVPGRGKIEVNKKSLEEYFPRATQRALICQPLAITDSLKRYDIFASVNGGGLSGQAGAMRHGLARALVKADENLKQQLKGAGFLTRDPRMKERKKTGQPGARKRFQFSKR